MTSFTKGWPIARELLLDIIMEAMGMTLFMAAMQPISSAATKNGSIAVAKLQTTPAMTT